jgi:hypothetical protein
MLRKARYEELDVDGTMLPQYIGAGRLIGWLHNIANGKCVKGGCALGRCIMSSTLLLHDKLRGVLVVTLLLPLNPLPR